MSELNLSIADIWMQNYEQRHSVVPCQGSPKNSWQPPSFQPITPSPQSDTGGSACLLNTLPQIDSAELSSRVTDPVVLAAIQTRKSLKLTQARFARSLGISPRTLGEWEQGRRQPSGAARTLLHWAAERPDCIKEALKAYRRRKD